MTQTNVISRSARHIFAESDNYANHLITDNFKEVRKCTNSISSVAFAFTYVAINIRVALGQ